MGACSCTPAALWSQFLRWVSAIQLHEEGEVRLTCLKTLVLYQKEKIFHWDCRTPDGFGYATVSQDRSLNKRDVQMEGRKKGR
jgi:hypothetical protein